MPVSAALHFSGKNSIIWYSQSSCSFVGLDRKAHSRVVGTSFPIPCSRLFLVALSVPHYEDAHFYTLGNRRLSTLGLQETVENGILNTRTSTHSAPLLQPGTAEKALENTPAEDGMPKPCKSSVLLENAHSESNKGNTPPRKKYQHTQETKEWISVRTREAMRDPKIREKIRKMREGSTLSSETKLKVKIAMMKVWNLKKKARRVQESCGREWEEYIADAARRGSNGDLMYQWDTYTAIRRASRKSPDHRKNRSNAMRAKWANPNYREKVLNGPNAYFSNRGTIRKRHTSKTSGNELSDGALSCDEKAGMVMALEQCRPNIHFKYKDPSIQHKLEKLKKMRSRRLFVEQTNLTERAWVLLAEAKKAADALEAAAIKDKSVLAPLIETRRLLEEAACSLQTADLGIDGPSSSTLEMEAGKETTT